MYNRKEWLANHVAEKHMVGVELGVLRGPTFKYLIENCPNLTLTGVDVFTPDWLWKARKIETTEDLRKIKAVKWYEGLVEYTEQFGGRANLIRDFTTSASNQFEDNSIDFVFIDADHSYDGVKEDIKMWEPKVKKGGLVSGHDINMLDVRMAVQEYNMNYDTTVDNVWYWRK